MVDADRPEFERILREIFGALDKPLTEHQRNAFWKGLARMSLLQFERCRDLILGDLESGEPVGRFGIAEVWAAKRRLRAAAPEQTAEPASDGWTGDKWDEEANQHFLALTLRRMRDPLAWRRPNELATYLAYKHRWAAQMRASDSGEGVPAEEQHEVWSECMRRAEGEVSAGSQPEIHVPDHRLVPPAQEIRA